MSLYPAVVVEAPISLGAARGTLLGTFKPTNPANERWQLGVTFAPTGCGPLQTWSETSGALKRSSVVPPAATFQAYDVIGEYACSSVAWGSPTGRAMARDYAVANLNARRSSAVERELWTGALSGANALGNAYLASPAAEILSSAPVNWTTAFARLQAGIRECQGDLRGVIHVSPLVAALGYKGALVRVVDDHLEDVFGNYVVAGAGYTGGAPSINQTYTISTTGATGGTFRLSVTNPRSGVIEQTAAIPYNASAAAIKSALVALSTVDASDVTTSGGALPAAVLVTFAGTYASQGVTLTGDPSLTGSPPALTVDPTTPGGSVSGEPATSWMYATGAVITRLSDITFPGDVEQGLDRTTNSVFVLAEQRALAGFDPCCHLAINADLLSGYDEGGV